MNHALSALSRAISIVLYPMFMPLYGMIWFCVGVHQTIAHTPFAIVYWVLALGGTILFTLLVPILMLWLLIRSGRADDFDLYRSEQRTIPYIYTAICYGFWCYFLRHILHMPTPMLLVAVGATVAILVVALVNLRWKISAHMTAIGGLIGGLGSYYLMSGNMSSPVPMMGLMIAAGILMMARLHQEAHTPLQVVCGMLLGIVCTFIPNWIIDLC